MLKATQKKGASKSEKRDYPLRNKRRLETRAALIKSAVELMAEHGFDNVTMQEVADNAGTHAQTLYSHFPNKYALSAAAAVESLRDAMSKRRTDTISFWRKWVKSKTKEVASGDSVGAFSGFITDTQEKARFALVNMAVSQEYVNVLTINLASDFGMDPKTDLFPKLVAEMFMAASAHNIFAWQDAQGDYDLLAGELSGVDEVAHIVELACAEKGIVIEKRPIRS